MDTDIYVTQSSSANSEAFQELVLYLRVHIHLCVFVFLGLLLDNAAQTLAGSQNKQTEMVSAFK